MSLSRRPPNVFAGGRIDRAAHLRRDPDWLAGRLADPATFLVPHWRGHALRAGSLTGIQAAASR
jgi:NAD+ diphosphatase